MNSNNEQNDLSLFMLSHIAARGQLALEDYLQAWRIAVADGVLDEKERRILQRLLDLLPPSDVPIHLKPRIDDLRAHYGI